MANIRHQVLIDAPVAKVYEAISTAEGISTWWDKQTPTQTDRGLVLEHNPVLEHGVVKLRVVELVPNKRVEWECISNHPKSSPASAWTGTHFIFEIAERDNVDSSGSNPNQMRAVGVFLSSPRRSPAHHRRGHSPEDCRAWTALPANRRRHLRR